MPKPTKDISFNAWDVSPTFSKEEVKNIRKVFNFPSDAELRTVPEEVRELAENELANIRCEISTRWQEYRDVMATQVPGHEQVECARTRMETLSRPALQDLLNEQLCLMATLLNNPEPITQPERLGPGQPKRRTVRKGLAEDYKKQLKARMSAVENLITALTKLPPSELSKHIVSANSISSLDQFRLYRTECHRKLYDHEIPDPELTRSAIVGGNNKHMVIGNHSTKDLRSVLTGIVKTSANFQEKIDAEHPLWKVCSQLVDDVDNRFERLDRFVKDHEELILEQTRLSENDVKPEDPRMVYVQQELQRTRRPSGTQPKALITEAIVQQLVKFQYQHTGELQRVKHTPGDNEMPSSSMQSAMARSTPDVYTSSTLDFIKTMLAKYPDFKVADSTFSGYISSAIDREKTGRTLNRE